MLYIITEISKKNGIGHFQRMLTLASSLHKKVCFILYKDLSYKIPKKIRYYAFSDMKELISFVEKIKKNTILIDLRKIPSNLRSLLSKNNCMYYDIPHFQKITNGLIINPIEYKIPKKLNEKLYYYSGFNFFIMKKKQSIKNLKKKTVLISFGGSDPKFLTEQIQKICSASEFSNYQFIIISPRQKQEERNKHIKIIPLQTTILPFIKKAEIIITSFGNTMLEAIAYKKKIILINPTLYHQKLSYKLEIISQTYYKNNISKRKLLQALTEVQSLPDNNFNFDTSNIMQQYLNKKQHRPIAKKCPVCGSNQIFIILNELDRKIYRCQHCSVNWLIKKKRKIENIYKNQYFLKEYKKQYGKTYLEDKKNIEALGGHRLQIIHDLRKSRTGRLLDVGAAYGFFLNVARQKKWDVEGIELIPTAIQYARKKLNLNVQKKSFEKMNLKNYDAITLWFVFEHLSNPILAFKKISSGLNKNGILALSVPNSKGLTAVFNRKEWLKNRPDDHFFDFSVQALNILAKKNSMKIAKIHYQGIYYERVQKIIPWIPNWKILNYVFYRISNIFGLGDTIEVYFKKV